MAEPTIAIRPAEFEQFRLRQGRHWRVAWSLVIALSLGCVFAIGVWSFAAGMVVGLTLPLVAYGPLKRWNRACWLSRFPGLARTDARWRPDPDTRDGGRLG